nr:uncharacterized protein LOC113814452 isoform X1 [Penaeus vannamei]
MGQCLLGMENPKPSHALVKQERKPSQADTRSNSNCVPHNPAGHVTPPHSMLTSDLADKTLQSVGKNGSPSKAGSATTDDLAAKLDHLHIKQRRPWYLSLLETPPVSGSLPPTSTERERDRRMRVRGGDDFRLRLRSDVTPPEHEYGARERDPWSRVYEGQRSFSRQRSPLREEELTPEMERLKEVMGFTSFFSPKDQWLQKSWPYDEEEEPVDILPL